MIGKRRGNPWGTGAARVTPKEVYRGGLRCGSALWELWVVLLLLVVLTLLPTAAAAAGSPSKASEKVVRSTLHNGLRVVIVRNPLAPVATTVVNYLVGSNEAPKGFPGMAHAQEHMMFRGCPGLSANQLANISAAMGGMFDADTQNRVTQYLFTVPVQDLDVALHVESLRMRGVLDSERLWQEERGAIEQEVAQDLSNPTYVFYTRLLKIMFEGTPYAHTPLGTRASFNQTTGAMLKKFHRTWYVPNNAILVIVGDVQPQKVLGLVKKYFGPIPARKVPPRPVCRLQPVTPGMQHFKTDLPVGVDVVSFRMPGYDSPDYAASVVLADVLSSQRGSFYALVPQGKALSAGFELTTFDKAGLGYAVAAFPKGGNSQKLLREIKQTLVRLVRKGFPASLVEAAKHHEVADAEFQKNSVSGLAMAWSQALAVEGRQSPEEDVKAIQKVSVADVDRVARRYLDFGHALEATLIPVESGKPVCSKSFSGVESFAPRHPRLVQLPVWAEKALQRLAVPASILNPQQSTLPNGIRLIVQPVSVSNTVSVFGSVRNEPDLEVPRHQEGVQLLLDRYFSYGTTSLDRLAFQKALDAIGASESAGTGFSVQVLSNHFARGVQLLADNELHPAFPKSAFGILRRQVAGTVAGELQSPDYLAGRALLTALFPDNDPSLRQPTPKSVAALTLAEVRHYYKKVFRPDLTTIVVIGNISPEKAKAVIEKYFGGWKAVGPKPPTLLPPVPLNKGSATVVPDSSRVQDRVTLAETLALNRSNPAYYALELGNRVLGGGFYATRLYQDLREKTGLVYYVSSQFDVGRTRGIYVVRYGCDPPNVNKAESIIRHDLRKMQHTLVSHAELVRAKAMLLRQIPLAESSVGSIAGGFISRVDLGLPLNEPTLAAHRYVKLDAQQVRAAFAKYLRPDMLVRVTQGPDPK